MNKIFYRSGIFLVLLVVFTCVFYWYEYRPTRIRHDCSWVKVVDPVVPAVPAITKEDVNEGIKKHNECMNENKPKYTIGDGKVHFDLSEVHCRDIILSEHPLIPEIPENIWYRKASKDEYNFCIYEKGL